MRMQLKIGSMLHNFIRFRMAQLAPKIFCFGMLSAIALAAMPATAVAQGANGFRSPSGNIHCQYVDGDDPAIRCDLRQMSNRPPPRPADCDLDFGNAFEISANAKVGTRLCYGDTVRNDNLPVLPYGREFSRPRIMCSSSEQGVECRNLDGHGFMIARASQRLF